MSQRNQHLTHAMLRKPATTTPKQFQTTWCFGKDWQHAGGGIETFNQQPCSPESCHSVTLARVLLFVKAAQFFAKKVTAAISFSGPFLFGSKERWLILPSLGIICWAMTLFQWSRLVSTSVRETSARKSSAEGHWCWITTWPGSQSSERGRESPCLISMLKQRHFLLRPVNLANEWRN